MEGKSRCNSRPGPFHLFFVLLLHPPTRTKNADRDQRLASGARRIKTNPSAISTSIDQALRVTWFDRLWCPYSYSESSFLISDGFSSPKLDFRGFEYQFGRRSSSVVTFRLIATSPEIAGICDIAGGWATSRSFASYRLMVVLNSLDDNLHDYRASYPIRHCR